MARGKQRSERCTRVALRSPGRSRVARREERRQFKEFIAEGRSSEGAFDVAWTRVVPLDQVRVVAVHNPDQVCEFGRVVRVETLSQPCASRWISTDRPARLAGMRSTKKQHSILLGVFTFFGDFWC